MAEEQGADPKTKEVLIVDDDESMLNLLSILVRRDGFRIDLAGSGDDALGAFLGELHVQLQHRVLHAAPARLHHAPGQEKHRREGQSPHHRGEAP